VLAPVCVVAIGVILVRVETSLPGFPATRLSRDDGASAFGIRVCGSAFSIRCAVPKQGWMGHAGRPAWRRSCHRLRKPRLIRAEDGGIGLRWPLCISSSAAVEVLPLALRGLSKRSVLHQRTLGSSAFSMFRSTISPKPPITPQRVS
jgi:hypothetical protein